MTHLMENYDREVRPVYNATKAVVVKVGITLTQIFDMVSIIIIVGLTIVSDQLNLTSTPMIIFNLAPLTYLREQLSP